MAFDARDPGPKDGIPHMLPAEQHREQQHAIAVSRREA